MLRRLLGALFGPKAPPFELPPDDVLTTTASGLRYRVVAEGEGVAPGSHDTVTVRYAGWLTDGTRFDASYPGTATFPLDRVIAGWTEGLQLVKPGGAIQLVIPPALGYGRRGAPPRIPPEAALVFHVEVLAAR